MQMITTLTQRSLVDIAVSYKCFNNKLTIIIDTSAPHGLFGKVSISLSNAQVVDVYSNVATVLDDIFNKSYTYSATTLNRLETSFEMVNGLPSSNVEITVEDNGTAIEAAVDNTSIDLPIGCYNFNLLDTADSEFSTSTISIKQLNIGNTGIDGVESIFDENGIADYLSINGQDLTFKSIARVSLKDNDVGVTNIPLVIYEC